MTMGSNRANIEKKVSELTSKTKLDRRVVHGLVDLYNERAQDSGMELADFRDHLMYHFNILDDFILDRIFRTMDTRANTKRLKREDFVFGMASFLTGDLEEKMKFCFRVYDLTGDGFITRDKMIQLLKSAMVTKSQDADQDDAEESIKELTELVMKKLDDDHDGRVSFNDFKEAIFIDTLMLESLGQCLPNETVHTTC